MAFVGLDPLRSLVLGPQSLQKRALAFRRLPAFKFFYMRVASHCFHRRLPTSYTILARLDKCFPGP